MRRALRMPQGMGMRRGAVTARWHTASVRAGRLVGSACLVGGFVVVVATGGCSSLRQHAVAASSASVAAPVRAPSGSDRSGAGRRAASPGQPVLSATALPSPTAYDAIDQAIRSARRSVDLVMYELQDPAAEAALESAARRGVDVRVLLDTDYHGGAVNRKVVAPLEAAGVKVFLAPRSVIVHQKTLVVDDQVAWIMTGNLTRRYEATSADVVVVDRDPTDVAEIVRAFDDDVEGDLVRSPSSVLVRGLHGDLLFSPGSQAELVALVDSARRSLDVTAVELADPAVVDAIGADARRGVRVELLMTEDEEWSSELGVLEGDGVRVRLEPDGARDLYIHAKVLVADGREAFVGSENLSEASLLDNRELGVVTREPSVVRVVQRAFRRWWRGAPIRPGHG